jgi:hypothetical protein
LKYAAAALCTVALTAAPLTGTAKASKPIFLRCVTSDGKPLYGKVVFDLDKIRNELVRPQLFDYRKTDRYITAVYMDEVGGDIFVLDKATSEFKRADLGLSCSISDNEEFSSAKCERRMKLNGFVQSGHCSRDLTD